MGISKLEDIIGQTQYLETIKGLDKQYKSIDLNDLLYKDESLKSHIIVLLKRISHGIKDYWHEML